MVINDYTVIFKPRKAGGYDIVVSAIPEICTFADNLIEARELASDAIRCYLESALERKEPIPMDKSISE